MNLAMAVGLFTPVALMVGTLAVGVMISYEIITDKRKRRAAR